MKLLLAVKMLYLKCSLKLTSEAPALALVAWTGAVRHTASVIMSMSENTLKKLEL